MTIVSRWEKERAAWLLARSKPGRPRRRRAELLARRGRQLARGGTSAGESPFHDDATERLFTRLMRTEEGSADKLARVILVPVAYAAVWLLLGGAIAAAGLIYRVLWALAPRIGRLWQWPWAVAAAGAGIAGSLLLEHGSPVDVSVWPRYMVVYVDWTLFWANWAWIQLSAGLLVTCLWIRETGWPAVPAHAARRPETDKHGAFLKTPDRQKARMDPLAGVQDTDDPVDRRGVETDEPVAEALAIVDDEGPVFADEDAGLDDGPQAEVNTTR